MADTINNVDLLASLDFYVEETSGFLDGPPVSREWARVSGVPGGRARAERLNERLFEVRGYVVSSSVAAAIANVRKLKALALRGVAATVNIALDIVPGYYVRANYAGFQEQTERPSHASRKRGVVMSFIAGNPPAYISSTLTTVSSIGAAFKNVPMGSANPYDAVLKLYQPTDPVVTVKNHNGDVVGDPMVFDFTYAAGEYLVIDHERGEIYRNLTGIRGTGTECSDTFVSGDFIELDYKNWDPVADAYGTIATSSGTGTLEYYKCDF